MTGLCRFACQFLFLANPGSTEVSLALNFTLVRQATFAIHKFIENDNPSLRRRSECHLVGERIVRIEPRRPRLAALGRFHRRPEVFENLVAAPLGEGAVARPRVRLARGFSLVLLGRDVLPCARNRLRAFLDRELPESRPGIVEAARIVRTPEDFQLLEIGACGRSIVGADGGQCLAVVPFSPASCALRERRAFGRLKKAIRSRADFLPLGAGGAAWLVLGIGRIAWGALGGRFGYIFLYYGSRVYRSRFFRGRKTRIPVNPVVGNSGR